eukprot:GHVH01001400.1.p1 GENE.GHVH01001400.1~~GHVH01001400.1.p1  ORF type:complete len:180 (+),score=4.87 GHVH01001400.1:96-635(+)
MLNFLIVIATLFYQADMAMAAKTPLHASVHETTDEICCDNLSWMDASNTKCVNLQLYHCESPSSSYQMYCPGSCATRLGGKDRLSPIGKANCSSWCPVSSTTADPSLVTESVGCCDDPTFKNDHPYYSNPAGTDCSVQTDFHCLQMPNAIDVQMHCPKTCLEVLGWLAPEAAGHCRDYC